MASSSFDYGYMKMSAIRKPFNYPEPTRRLSWDDFSVFYQTANDWDYPVNEAESEQSNKSQNPSPKNESNMEEHDAISPLSTGRTDKDHYGSETDDVDTSASSIDDISNHNNHIFKIQGSRDSMDDDILDTDDDYGDHDSSNSISIPHDDINQHQDDSEYNDDAKNNNNNNDNNGGNGGNDDMDAISISLSRCDDNENKQDINSNNEGGTDRNEYTYYDKETRLILMEIKVNDLNETVSILMKRIQELTNKNKYLRSSKMELINNTSNAMNEYRETIRRLNQQNNILLKRIKRI